MLISEFNAENALDFVRETHGRDVAEDFLLREVARLRDPDCDISEKGLLTISI
jgi:hypothetical protein